MYAIYSISQLAIICVAIYPLMYCFDYCIHILRYGYNLVFGPVPPYTLHLGTVVKLDIAVVVANSPMQPEGKLVSIPILFY